MKFKLLVICCAVIGSLLGCQEEEINKNQTIFETPSIEKQIEIDDLEEICKEPDVYYVTPYGEKYHHADCSYIRRDLCECGKYTDIEAEKRGYNPCSRCIG